MNERAERAAQVLDLAELNGSDPESALVDVLADLMHYCHVTSRDFDESLRIARQHFEEEV